MLAIELPHKTLEANGRRIESEFFAACEWLSSLGLFPNGNRFSVYRKTITEFGAYERVAAPVSETVLYQYLSALSEANELLRIKQTLESSDSTDFLSRLRQITSGTAFRNGIGPDPARDFTFELSVASRFLHAGYEVSLSGLADLTVVDRGRSIFVECKRVQSESKLLRRIDEAKSQIERRLEAARSIRNRGLAAVKVTDILNPNRRHVVMRDAAAVHAHSNGILNGLVESIEGTLKKKIAKRQLGILFENNIQGIVYAQDGPNDDPAIIHCRGGSLYYRKASVEDEASLTEIAMRLRDQHVIRDV